VLHTEFFQVDFALVHVSMRTVKHPHHLHTFHRLTLTLIRVLVSGERATLPRSPLSGFPSNNIGCGLKMISEEESAAGEAEVIPGIIEAKLKPDAAILITLSSTSERGRTWLYGSKERSKRASSRPYTLPMVSVVMINRTHWSSAVHLPDVSGSLSQQRSV